MDVAAEVYVRRARDFVVKFAVDFACQHQSELPPTEYSPSNTVCVYPNDVQIHITNRKR